MVTSNKCFLHYLVFVMENHLSSVHSPLKGPVIRSFAVFFVVMLVWTSCWMDSLVAGDLRQHVNLYDITLMVCVKAARLAASPLLVPEI